ncbi:unnamed protein product, partial [Scytosiphon promiscuus]
RNRNGQGACVVLSGREDRSFITHRGSTAHFCREDIDVPRLLESQHVHVGEFPTTSGFRAIRRGRRMSC